MMRLDRKVLGFRTRAARRFQQSIYRGAVIATIVGTTQGRRKTALSIKSLRAAHPFPSPRNCGETKKDFGERE
jgi:hypothetical protein